MQAQDGVVLEHPAGEVALRLELDFHVNEDELPLSVAGLEPGDHVGLAHLAFGDVGEDFLAEETQRLEVEPGRGFGEEELEEIPEQSFQNRFEQLVVSHPACPPPRRKTKSDGRSLPVGLGGYYPARRIVSRRAPARRAS